MKKFILPFFIASFIANAQVTTFPWTETFEDASPTASQWVYEYISGTNSSATNNVFWTLRTSSSVGYVSNNTPYAGTKMLDFDPRSFSNHSGRFISPVLNLSTSTNPTLDFFYRNLVWGTDQNILEIYYRTSSTAPWVLITTLNTSIPNWVNSGQIALPNPSATYQIAFVGIAKYGYAINIDDLKISSLALSVSDVNSNKIKTSIYPNPVADELNANSEFTISSYTITDYSGKKIKSQSANSKEIKISVRDLSSGNYILILKDQKGNTSTQKFIKK